MLCKGDTCIDKGEPERATLSSGYDCLLSLKRAKSHRTTYTEFGTIVQRTGDCPTQNTDEQGGVQIHTGPSDGQRSS